MKAGLAKVAGLHLLLLLLGGCGSGSGEPPLTRATFCVEWAKRACSAETVSACQASSVEACQASQEQFCFDNVPTNFTDDNAQACLTAVGNAYKDADLDAEELRTVIFFGDPCDTLAKGPGQEGSSCTSNANCDITAKLECVIKSASGGTCQVPEEVGAGFECSEPQQSCAEGFFCNGENCIAAKGTGSACTRDAECSTANYCNGTTCAARGSVGTTCTANEQCLSGVCLEYGGTFECTDRVVLARSEPLCDHLR